MLSRTDTIAALATPVGTAALAVLRASGADTRRIAAEIIGGTPPPRVARHHDYHSRDGSLIDDVVVTFFEGPRSYTGEDALEITCHGNPYIAQKILEDLFSRGCRPAEPGEFTQRAFLNGRMDLSEAEAVMDVIHARSDRALAAANQQLRGALGRRMEGLTEALLGVLARIEAYIDFPEEDLPPEDRDFVAEALRRLIGDTERLLATSHYGDLIRDGIKTVIVGEPNVGKSSLLNRLVGRDRALVSAEPGTTRDFIEERIMLGHHWLRLIDTAGLNTSPAPLESLGMQKTRERLAEADLALVVVDGSRELTGMPDDVAAAVEGLKCIIVRNKSDLRSSKTIDIQIVGAEPSHDVSALTGAGIAQLVGAICDFADSFRLESGDEIVAINARHAQALSEARACLREATAKLEALEPLELVASGLRSVLTAYGEIVGKVDNERMLDQLFATFCIGK